MKTTPIPVKFDRQGHSCNFYGGFGPTLRRNCYAPHSSAKHADSRASPVARPSKSALEDIELLPPGRIEAGQINQRRFWTQVRSYRKQVAFRKGAEVGARLGACSRGRGPPSRKCISGLVVEYIVAIDVTRVRFPADASQKLFHILAPCPENARATPRGFEPLRAEPNGFRVHLLSRSDTVSCRLLCA